MDCIQKEDRCLTMSTNKSGHKGRAVNTSSKAEWLTHIRSLGLNSVGEYERWCRRHNFTFNRRKTWRQEREERHVVDIERRDKEANAHIRALGLETTDSYLAWCQQNGFRQELNKKPRQRQKELALFQQQQAPALRSTFAVTMQHVRALGLESTDDYRAWGRQNNLGDALDKTPAQLDKDRAINTLTMAKRQMRKTRDLIAAMHAGRLSRGRGQDRAIAQDPRRFFRVR
ncbi:MAG: hypothetical protein ACI8PG_002781 [Planctomycetota bacterium]|jgi:hypothetical protein